MSEEPRYCEAMVFVGNRIDPPEYCDEEAEPESDYCERHRNADRDLWDEADDAHERLRDERLGM